MQLNPSILTCACTHFNPLIFTCVCTQVTVQFRAINGSALDKQDFSLLSYEVVLSSGETSKLVPMVIVDDLMPELRETFTVELLDAITGGAVLGTNRSAVITIEASDDPNGVFGELLQCWGCLDLYVHCLDFHIYCLGLCSHG